MGIETTSVPRWPSTAPPPDQRGTNFTVVTVGEAAQSVGIAWTQELSRRRVPFRAWHVEQYSPTVEAQLRQQIATVVVGWRLMVSGPQAVVARVLRVALAAGAVSSELCAQVTEAGLKHVRCTHCWHTNEIAVNVGDTAPCAGCGRMLLVYHHFSRSQACYMGLQADAEDLAAG